MMFDFRGEGWGPKMTLKNRTLGGRWPGEGGSKVVKNRRTSFMDDP